MKTGWNSGRVGLLGSCATFPLPTPYCCHKFARLLWLVFENILTTSLWFPCYLADVELSSVMLALATTSLTVLGFVFGFVNEGHQKMQWNFTQHSNLIPLSLNIHIHILLTVLHIFLMLLVGRIWLKINTFHVWWSFLLFSWLYLWYTSDIVRRNQMLVTLGA